MQLLEGVRVLESAQLFNGDTLGSILADLGADVIKIESPFRGDYLRDILGQVTDHNSPAHIQVNKNKRSVAVDLRSDAGRSIFFDLLKTADVFVDGNSADALDKLGVGFEAQQAVKPDVIYCQYTGFGSTGPYSTIPTHGKMMNAAAGAVPLKMGEDGLVRADSTPQFFHGITSGGEGTAAGAVYAALHVAAAIVRRQASGRGGFIDVSASEAVLSSAWIATTYILNEHRITDRRGMPERAAEDQGGPTASAKYQYYETRDSKFVLFCCIEHTFWDNFCRAVGREDLMENKNQSRAVDFASGEGNLWLRRELQTILWGKDQREWINLAAASDFALGPAVQPAELPGDDQLRERGVFMEGVHPHAGPFTHLTLPGIVDGTRSTVLRRHAPALGEQTEELLADLGYSAEQLNELAEAKVIGGVRADPRRAEKRVTPTTSISKG
jgi:crotonobetainyl-CoA:carnitine CoA-transferase CaiB-like acyl-CoA transferase